MRIGALSKRSGVPVPTIKFYMREGLLPAGSLTHVNQAQYEETHLRRLRLLQALSQVGGLSVKQLRGILALMEKPDFPVHELLGQTLLSGIPRSYTNDEYSHALAEVDALISRYRWQISDDSPARIAAAAIVATLCALGTPAHLPMGLLDRFAYHADAMAFGDDTAETPEQALIDAVIGDRLLLALRRLAEENVQATMEKGAQ